ncbi:hypothetical protein ACEQ8H_005966 [Pleosporales sp. CAS-2024a]
MPLPSDNTPARVSAWLESGPSSIPLIQTRPDQPKRRRSGSSEGSHAQYMRPASPKRRQGEDNIVSGRSASRDVDMSDMSDDDMDDMDELNRRNQQNQRSAASSRSVTPERQKTLLRTVATPRILLDPLSNPSSPIPSDVAVRLRALRLRLSVRLASRFIPISLRTALETDPALQPSLRHEPIDASAYDESDQRPPELCARVLDRVKTVLQGTQMNTFHQKDASAWTLDVVLPLLDIAFMLHGRDRFRRELVQMQPIQDVYIPSAVHHKVHDREQLFFRNADLCFCYSHLHPKYSALYARLPNATLSHTTNVFTRSAALYSGIAVKQPNNNTMMAQLQLSVWMSANLRKKADLARCVRLGQRHPHWPDKVLNAASVSARPPSPSDDLPIQAALIEPAVTVLGAEHKVYYGFLAKQFGSEVPWNNSAASVLGPDDRLPLLTTHTVQGILQLARLYGNIFEYGADESPDGYWGAFLGPTLERMASERGICVECASDKRRQLAMR